MNWENLYFEYGIDEQIAERFISALLMKDEEAMADVIGLVGDRFDGRCFCHAHSSNECVCGAWE